MAESLKKLTVSYGAFSCTLEGFDDPFPVMKQVVDYFQNLADRDPSFGAHPERPDADYLRSLAERTVGGESVEAEVHDGGVILRQSGAAATDFAGMNVVEETIVVEPAEPEQVVAEAVEEEAQVPEAEEIADAIVASDMAEDFAVVSALPEKTSDADGAELPDAPAASAGEPVSEADMPAATNAAEPQPELDDLAALHADMERFESEPLIDEPPETADADVADTAIAEADEDAASQDDAEDTKGDFGEEAAAPAELSSRLPDWAADLISPAAKGDFDNEFDVVDFGDGDDGGDTQAAETETDAPDEGMSGASGAAPASTDPEDAALERLLRVTQSRRVEPAPEISAMEDPLSEIRQSVLGLNAEREEPATDAAQDDSLTGAEEATEAEDVADLEILDGAGPDEAPEAQDELHDLRAKITAETRTDEEERPDGSVAPDPTPPYARDDAHGHAEPFKLAKPMRVLEPLKLTSAFRVADEAPAQVTEKASLRLDRDTAGTDELEPDAIEEDRGHTERGNFRLVHNRKPDSETPAEPMEFDEADDGLSLESFASKVGAASLPELLEASAAYTTIVAGQTRFSRRSIMGMLDEFNTSRGYSQEARIKSFGKLIRSGTILRVEDGQFAISRSAKYDYEMKIGA